MQCKSCQCAASALPVARKSGAATNVSFYLLCSRGGWLDSAGKWTMGTKAANPAECDPDGQRGDPCCHTASPRGDLKAVQLCVRVRDFFFKIMFHDLVSFGLVSFCVLMPCRNRSNKLDIMLGLNVGSSCQFVKGCQINTAAALILSLRSFLPLQLLETGRRWFDADIVVVQCPILSAPPDRSNRDS